jgi:hypothetical protein
MNIFFLDRDPGLAAQYHCNKHVVKMILETAQILSNNATLHYGREIGYGTDRHVNHPCTMWARQNWVNWDWLAALGVGLCEEYHYRYGKVHACQQLIYSMGSPASIRSTTSELSFPALCMPSIYRGEDPVKSYRDYYIGEKYEMLTYTKRPIPDWLASLGLGEQK